MALVSCPVLALLLALPAATPARTRQVLLRGQTDQNQPLLLRVDRRRHRLQFRIGLLVTRCRGRGGNSSNFGAPRADTLRPHRPLPIDRAGRARASYTVRRHPYRPSIGDESDARLRSRVIFRANIGRRAASGTLRVRTFVRQVYDDSEGTVAHWRFVCDSGTRRWRVPRVRFSGPWRPTGPVLQSLGALVPLADGRALADSNNSGEIGETQVYSPRSNRWTRTGRQPHPRSSAVMVPLSDGGALAIGGLDFKTSRPATDVGRFAPRTNSWSAAASMPSARQEFAVAALADGRVLVAGGLDGAGSPTAASEIYDPRSNAWSPAANLPPPFGSNRPDSLQPSATLLSSGSVLLVGSFQNGAPARTTTYDPNTDRWSSPQPLPAFLGSSFANFRTVRLPDGRALLVNCSSDGVHTSTGIYGPAGWQPAAPAPFCGGAFAALPSGRVLYAGGGRRAYIYDPASHRWTRAPAYRFPHGSCRGCVGGLLAAPTPRGALLADPSGLNRYSSTERFYER